MFTCLDYPDAKAQENELQQFLRWNQQHLGMEFYGSRYAKHNLERGRVELGVAHLFDHMDLFPVGERSETFKLGPLLPRSGVTLATVIFKEVFTESQWIHEWQGWGSFQRGDGI